MNLIAEAERFRAWAESCPLLGRSAEWECDYKFWPALYEAVLGFVDARPFESWSEEELRAVLYSIARDNECQHLAKHLREQHPNVIVPLARAALRVGECDDRWQLAVELGELGMRVNVEQLLMTLAHDEHEYVRRRALKSLMQVGSPLVEELALAAWHRPDEHQEWARMNALYCLHKVGSPSLEPLLTEAEADSRQYLCAYAMRIRRDEFLD
jgi:HEAT repeat protein